MSDSQDTTTRDTQKTGLSFLFSKDKQGDVEDPRSLARSSIANSLESKDSIAEEKAQATDVGAKTQEPTAEGKTDSSRRCGGKYDSYIISGGILTLAAIGTGLVAWRFTSGNDSHDTAAAPTASSTPSGI